MRQAVPPASKMAGTEGAEGAEFAFDDDCLQSIVACTSSASTLFALARVSPTLQRFVLARLNELDHPPPCMSLHSHRALLRNSLHYVGATVGNQTITFNRAIYIFSHETDEEVWKRFLGDLPALKRIFLLSCCHNGLMNKVRVRVCESHS